MATFLSLVKNAQPLAGNGHAIKKPLNSLMNYLVECCFVLQFLQQV